MTIALVYTSTTPELIELMESEVIKNVGPCCRIISFQDPSILSEIREAGYVTPAAANRLIGLYVKAIDQGADVILNICSSVGDVADAFQETADYIGVPVIRIDEEMCREAVRQGTRIGVIATLQTTVAPTKKTIERASRCLGKHIEVIGVVVDAFGSDREKFRQLLTEAAQELAKQVDVIVLAQGSMAYVEKEIADSTKTVTLSSPRFGAVEIKKALQAKGLI